MKQLCFGTILNLIFQAKSQGVTYLKICKSIFKAFDTDPTYLSDKTLPSHLKSGHDNVPPDVIESAREKDYKSAIDAVDLLVTPLIAEKQKTNFIRAIQSVLKEDTINDDTVIGYSPFTKKSIIENNKFVFSPLLASVLRYSIVDISNHACESSLKGFESSYLSTMDERVSIFIESLKKERMDEPDEPENEQIGSLKPTLIDNTFGHVFRRVSSIRVSGITHPSTAEIYCADVRNCKIHFSKVKDFLADNISTYVFSRAEINSYDSRHRPPASVGTKALIKFQKAYGSNADSMLGELLLYIFLEHELHAPKIMSKIEFFTQADGTGSRSDGIHLLANNGHSWPFNQLVFGASDIQGNLNHAVDRAFERIAAIEHNDSYEYRTVEKTAQYTFFDNQTNEYIRSLLIPSRNYESKPEMAFGLFLGYTLTIEPSIKDSTLYKKAAEEQLKEDIKSVKEYIALKISEYGYEGYSFYCYILPFNDAPAEKTGLIDEMLRGEF